MSLIYHVTLENKKKPCPSNNVKMTGFIDIWFFAI